MKGLSPGLMGVGILIMAFILTLGSLTTALAETPPLIQAATTVEFPTATPIMFTTPTMPLPIASATPISFSTDCDIPEGWVAVIVGKKDSLDSLAEDYGTSVKKIVRGNCLESESIQQNDILYLPPITPTDIPDPTREPPPMPLCHPYRPNGWIKYKIRPGDTLGEIAQTFDVSFSYLQQVNCIFYPDYLMAGEILYVPYNPTNTPKPTKTPVPTDTSTPTEITTPTETPTP